MFIKLTRPSNSGGPNREVAVRSDHILEMSPNIKEGSQAATWLLIQHTGWFPAVETIDEILHRISVGYVPPNPAEGTD